MPNKIDGLGGSSYDHTSRALIPYTKPDVEVSTQSSSVVQDPKNIQEIDPGVHSDAFCGFRNAISPVVGLQRFVIWLAGRSDGLAIENAQGALVYDPSISEAIHDLAADYERAEIELVPLLKNMLIKSEDFKDKVILIKMLIALDKEDELFADFLTPALERRKKFDNADANNNFAVWLMTDQDEVVQMRVLRSLDYRSVTNIDNFAASLTRIKDPDWILDRLIAYSEHIGVSEVEGDEKAQKQEKIQKTALKILKTLDETTLEIAEPVIEEPPVITSYVTVKPESVVSAHPIDQANNVPVFKPDNSPPIRKDHIRRLYEISVDPEISNQLMDLQRNHYALDAPKLSKAEFTDDSDTSIRARRRRFAAITHYTNSAGKYATNTLKEFVQKEKDPFLVAHACYALANNCGVDGQRALVFLIVDDIKKGRASIPLAAITQMAKYGKPYRTVLKGVLFKDYDGENNIKQAYANLASEEFGTIYKGDNGIMTFYYNSELHPDLAVDLVSDLSLGTFAEWAAYGRGHTAPVRENFKKNALDILDFAWESNSTKMRELALEAMTFGSETTMSLITRLIGMSNY